jgi:integrase
MATVRKRGKSWHIQWYEPFEKKTKSLATGLVANETNRKKAEQYAKQLQSKLTHDYRKQKELGIQRVTIKEAFEHFKKINQNKNIKTIADYDRFYKKFTAVFDENLPCTNINKLNIENWLMEIKKLNFAQNTIHGYGKQLTHFLNFLFEYSYTQMFKINREVKTRAEIKEKVIFSDADFSKIMKNLKKKNLNFVTAINLLAYTGLRPSDLMTIKAENIDLLNRTMRYYSPKRKKFREIAFHEKLVPVLRKRIKEVRKGLILNYNNTENFGRAIRRYMEVLYFKGKQYSARTFRKTFISLCRSKYNMDASVVMELVGHEHLNTTDRYYNKISFDVMNQELKKYVIPVVKEKKKKLGS